MCFAPQRCALFRHRNFQKWSDHGVFCTFWLGNVLRATTACNFSSLIWPAGSAPAALASLLFDPPEPQIIGKTQWTATFLPFHASPSSFFLLFLFYSSLFWSLSLLSASALLCFSSVHIVGSLTSKLPSTTTLRYTTLITLHWTKTTATLPYTILHYITLYHTTPHNTPRHYTALQYTNYTNYTTPRLQLQLHLQLHIIITLHYSYNSTPLHYNYNYNCNYYYNCTTPTLHPAVVVRWPLQPLQPFQKTRLQPPFGPSVESLCHPWFTKKQPLL